MPRPPQNRNRSRRSRPTGRGRPLFGLLVLLAAYTLIQYLQDGRVSWPGTLYRQVVATLGDTVGSEDAGWRHVADAAGALGDYREGSTPPAYDFTGRVVRISDGDTVSVLDRANQQHKVRLFGIDTPERDQPHGNASRRALADMVDNRQVGVVVVETDDYGRTVGVLYRDDRHINLAMIASGNAWWYRYYAPHERQFEAAETAARQQRIGLWRDERPIPPWDWRRGRR